jgi:hypothetical protein
MAVPVDAQKANGTWEVEFHAAGGPVSNPTDGTASLPAAAPPFTTVVGTTSRRTSSWYFGDGAVLLNQVNAALGVTPRITPLDPVFQGSLADRRRGASVGIRVSRGFSRRFSAEFAFDYALGRLTMSPPALAGIEAARASFAPALTALIASGPFVGSTVTSATTIHDGGGRQTFATGAFNINLKTSGKVIPYITAGAGVIVNIGETPSASLEGNYRFQVPGLLPAPVSETDRVTLRTSIDDGIVGVVGGGLKFLVSRHWGIRFDLRGLLNEVSTDMLLGTGSTASTLSPAGVAASTSTPSVQFSNNPGLGSSSLSAPPITDFRSFTSRGLQSQTNITAGLFLRF